MTDLAFVALLTLWSAGTGLWVLRRFGPWPEERLDALALALPIGFGLLALGSLGLGEVGELDAGRLEAMLGVGAVVGVPGLLRWAVRGRTAASRNEGRRFEWTRTDTVIAACLGLTITGSLLTALAPVTDGDALCYHLQVPKEFLRRGAVGFDPDLHETVYPLSMEMVYALALAFRGPVACRLVQWVFGVVLSLNVNALARPFLGRRAWWAGALALAVPAVNNGMSAPLNDVALAAYGCAALHAWSRYRDNTGVRPAALTGLVAGLALGVKYPALVLAGLIGAAVAPGFVSRWWLRLASRGAGLRTASRAAGKVTSQLLSRYVVGEGEDPPRRRLGHLAAYGMFALAAGGVWYARAFVHTGNPVHPYFRATFGGAGIDEVLGPEKRPMPVDPMRLLTALGPLTLRPDTFDSFSHQFGPVFLLFLPALLWERPPRKLLGLVGLGYAFLALCLTQRQSMRFVLTAVGPMSVGVAWLAARWQERATWPARALVGVLIVAVTFEATIAAARARHGLDVVVGVESPASYLERSEPTYRVGAWVHAHLPSSARLIGQDHRGYYIPRPYTMELAHRRRTGLGRNGESAEDVVRTLHREGFTHLLMDPPVPESAVEFDPTLGRLLAPWLAAREPVYREDLTDGDGVTRRFAIYALTDDRLASLPDRPAP
jgi:hypothetical protein